MTQHEQIMRWPCWIGIVVLLLFETSGSAQSPPRLTKAGELGSPPNPAQMRQEDEYDRLLVQYVRGTDLRGNARGWRAYRDKYGNSPDVDYMLARSLCRIPETVRNGYEHFRWMVNHYHLDVESIRLIKRELDGVRIRSNRPRPPVTFEQYERGWVARVKARLIIPAFSDFVNAAETETLSEVETAFKREMAQALGSAAGRHDAEGIKVLRFLLDRGADARGKDGRYALWAASSTGSADAVRILIDHGVDLKDNGPEALLNAAGREDKDGLAIVQVLYQHKVDLNKQDKEDIDTALLAAVRSGTLDMVRFLLENEVAVNVGYADTFRSLPNITSDQIREVDAGAMGKITVSDWDDREIGSTALMFAAGRGDADSVTMIKLLLAHGATVKGLDGTKALLYAAAASSAEKLRLLIDAGINVNAQNESGATALMVAAEYGATDAVKFLLSRGAIRQLRNRAGQTALGIATAHGYSDVVVLLK